jgi:hypothetical protein
MFLNLKKMTPSKNTMLIEAYCLKCKHKVAMESPKAEMTSTGRPYIKGVCPGCDSKVSLLVSKGDTMGSGLFGSLFAALKPALTALKPAIVAGAKEAVKQGTTEAGKALGKAAGEALGQKLKGKGFMQEAMKNKSPNPGAKPKGEDMKEVRRKLMPQWMQEEERLRRGGKPLLLVPKPVTMTHTVQKKGTGIVKLLKKK